MKKLIRKLRHNILVWWYSIRGLPPWPGNNDYGLVPAFMLDGEVFYTFSDMMQIPMMRQVMGASQLEMINAGITTQLLAAYIDKALQCLNSEPRNHNEVVRILDILKQRAGVVLDPMTLLKFSAIAYVRRGEDVVSLTEPQINQKTQEFINRGLDGFFLGIALPELTKLLGLEPDLLAKKLNLSLELIGKETKHLEDRGILPRELSDSYAALCKSVRRSFPEGLT